MTPRSFKRTMTTIPPINSFQTISRLSASGILLSIISNAPSFVSENWHFVNHHLGHDLRSHLSGVILRLIDFLLRDIPLRIFYHQRGLFLLLCDALQALVSVPQHVALFFRHLLFGCQLFYQAFSDMGLLFRNLSIKLRLE